MNEVLLNKAASYCSSAEHCEQEVRQKLIAWGSTEPEADEIIDYLYLEQYLSAERYCQAFVHDKLRFQQWGRQKIRMMLALKRLPREAVNDAIGGIDEEQYQSVLREVLQRKRRSLSPSDPQLKQKLIRFAAARGFEYDSILSTLES